MVELKLFGFQRELVRTGLAGDPIDYLFLLAHGGRGSGKTTGGASRALAYVGRYPGSQGMITAPTYPVMHSATLPTLLKLFSDVGLKRGRDYHYIGQREEITILRGAQPTKIFLRTTEHPEKLAGPTLAWFWMDEARNSPAEAFRELKGALRQQGFPHQAWVTTTPIDKRHWLYEYWHGQAPTGGDSHDTYLAMRGHTKENPFGGYDLWLSGARELGMGSLEERRQYGGEFVLMEGLVYPDWNPELHLLPLNQWPGRPNRTVVGVDFGYTAPTAMWVYGWDKEGRRYGLEAMKRTQMAESEVVAEARRLTEKYHASYVVCDDADPGRIAALRKAGLPAVRARKGRVSRSNPSSRIALCANVVRKPGGFYVLKDGPGISLFVDEIEGYTTEEARSTVTPSEQPKKFQDHLMDAWGYAEGFVWRVWDRGRGQTARVIPSVEQRQGVRRG